jgi:hypothetical protein
MYYNTATWGSPSWTEVSVIEGVEVESAYQTVDVILRDRRTVGKVKGAMGLTATVKMIADITDTVYLAFLAAHNAGTVLDVMILKGGSTTNGVSGYRFETQVHKASESQGANAVVMDEIELAPYPGENKAASVLVASGAPVFSSIAF